MTNTEIYNEKKIEFLDGSTKKIIILVSDESKVENYNDNYITLVNGSSSLYSPDDFSLKQYKFYYSYKFNPFTGNNHKDYLLNASVIINYAIEEFKLRWKIAGNKSSTISAYYTPLVGHVETSIYYNKLPEPAMLKSSTGNVFKGIDTYINEIIKKMIYFSIYNIKNDGTLLPIEILRNTFSTFDCYTNFPYEGGYANLTEGGQYTDEEFKWFLENKMNVFVDEIETKIDIDTGLFYELKKDFTNPRRIIENIYDGKNKENLDLAFFYDTTIIETDVYISLNNLIIKFNTLAGNYKKALDNFAKSLNQATIDKFKSKTLDYIVSDSSESATFIEELIGSNSTDADKLALKILLQFHNKAANNKEFAVRTFETFDTFKQIVNNTDGIEQAYSKIEIDLKSTREDNGLYTSESQFLYEFKDIIKKLYETLIPASFKKQKLEGGVNIRLGDAFPSKYDILANTELDIDYYTRLEQEYKNAKEDYARFYRVDPKSKEAEEILKKVCSDEYSNENSFGANWTNEEPDFKLKEYESILYRYLYYAVFEPQVHLDTYPLKEYDSGKKHREFRDKEEVIKYLSNYDSEIDQVAGINEDEEPSTAEEFYETVKYILIATRGGIQSPLSILSTIARRDFRQFAESKRNLDEKVREKETPKVELVKILPNGFSENYKILVDKGEDSDKLESLLAEWNSYLAEYEGIIESKDEDEKEKFKKSFLSPWEEGIRDNYLLKGEVIKIQPTRDEKSAFIKNLSFFYIYSNTNKIPKTSFNNYEIDQKIESIDKHYRRKQTGTNAVTAYSNGNGRILISGKNYDVKQLHTLFKKLASDVLKSTEIDVIEKLRVIEADKLREKQKELYNKYLTEIKNRVSLEKQFFFLEDMLKKKTIPTIPAIDIEFRDEYVDEKGEEKTNWVSVSRMRSDKTNSNLVDETSVSGNELYGYNYFENMTLEDTGGKKEISLTLKGIEDLNLEKIIYNSLTRPVKKFNETFWKKGYTKNADTIQKINDYRVSNFRVRFGYNDTTYGDSAINETNINSVDFSNRIKNDKPVVKSPWLYFLINKLDTNFVDGETVFEVGGVNIGNYVLENYRIYNPASNSGSFSFNDMTAVGAIGKIADIFFRASNKTICILSGDSDKIIVNSEYNIKNKIYEHKYATINFKGNKKDVLKKSDFDFQGFSMETQAGVKKDTSNFTIVPGEKEESDGSKERNLPTAQQVLDALINFLPTKLYIAPTFMGNESFMAMPVEKTFDNMVKSLAKELRISYDIVEAETQIDSNITEFKDSEWKRRSFIRLYYKGPISRDEEKDEKIRFYKYRGGNESVIKSISIQNPLDLQKISGVVCGFENTKKARIFMSQVGVTPENIGGVGSKVEILMDENETTGPMLVHKGSTTTTNTDGSEAISNISKIANSLTDYTYTGNMEILGDPYYIFDDDLEPFRHKIYLKVNRYKSINLQELADGNYDYYSGLYVVKNITHKLDSSGSFTTNLGLMKFTMASNNKENEQGN